MDNLFQDNFKIITKKLYTPHYKNGIKDKEYISISAGKIWDSGPMVFMQRSNGWIPVAIQGVHIRTKDNNCSAKLVLNEYSFGTSISTYTTRLCVANLADTTGTMSSIILDVLCIKGDSPLSCEEE